MRKRTVAIKGREGLFPLVIGKAARRDNEGHETSFQIGRKLGGPP